MALSGRRAADNVARNFLQRFQIQIPEEGKQFIAALFDGMIQEIRENLEADGVESPAEGYTVTVDSSTVNVDGTSVTGSVPRGKFR